MGTQVVDTCWHGGCLVIGQHHPSSWMFIKKSAGGVGYLGASISKKHQLRFRPVAQGEKTCDATASLHWVHLEFTGVSIHMAWIESLWITLIYFTQLQVNMATLQTRQNWLLLKAPTMTMGQHGAFPPAINKQTAKMFLVTHGSSAYSPAHCNSRFPVMGCAKCSDVAVLQIRLGRTTSQGRRSGFPHNLRPPIGGKHGNSPALQQRSAERCSGLKRLQSQHFCA